MPNELKVENFPKVINLDNKWLTKRDELLSTVKTVTEIVTQEQYEGGEILLKKLTTHSNALEKQRKTLSKPFSDMAKQIKALADGARNDLEIEKSKIKKLLLTFITEQEQEREKEAQKQIEEAVKNPFAEFTPVVPETPKVTKLMTSARLVWKFEITNPVDVPRAFCSPDEKKIREHMVANKDGSNIPGVRFFQESTIQSR